MKGTHFEKPAPGGSIRRQIVNPDLQEERDKCNFDADELEDFVSVPGQRDYYDSIIEDHKKHPELMTPHSYLEMTREE